MKLIEQLKSKLAKVGATLDEGDYTLNCDAPSGYVWHCNGCHAVAIHYATNSQSWLAKAVPEAIKQDLSLGLDKVTDTKEIESYRWTLGDDTWGASADAPDRIEWHN